MTALLSFLLGNWKWILPVVLFAGLAVDDFVHRVEATNCQAARASDMADAEKAKSAALARAQALSDELIIAQAQAMAVTEKTVTVYRDRIINAPKTSSCGPVLRDAAHGVLDTLNPGGGQAPAGGNAAPAVQPATRGR